MAPHLRILVTNWNDRASPYAGGADVHLHEVFGRLARRGHEVTLLAAGWKGAAPRATLDDIDIHRVGGRHTFTLAARRYFDAHLRRRNFDVVVEDLNKIPLLVQRWSRAPFVLLVHHLWGRTAVNAGGPLIGLPTWAAEAALIRRYRGLPVQAVSDSTARDLVHRGIDPRDIRVITNGADRPTVTEPSVPDPRPTLLALGRLQSYKRVDRLFPVLARVRERIPDVRLLVIGDGPDAARLRAEAVRTGVSDAVEFLGFVTDAVKRQMLSRAWLNVIASEREGWGLTVVEAGAYGVPTVAGDVPGLRDAVVHERSGLLVPDDDLPAFTEAVVHLLQHGEHRQRLGAGARRLADYYTWDRTAVTTEEHLQEVAVLGRSRRGWAPLAHRPWQPTLPTLAPSGASVLPFGRSTYLMLASRGPCDPVVPIQLTFGADDAEGLRPGLLVEGLPEDASLAVEAFASAVEAIPAETGILLSLPGWPVQPERWLWEELGAALRGLRPRAIYRP